MESEKKKEGNAHTRAQNKYIRAKYDRLGIVIRKDGGDGFTMDQLKRAAAREGLSVNGFVVYCLRDKI